jgi:hypothetical protein
MFDIFKSIINGELKPHLIKKDNLTKLQDSIKNEFLSNENSEHLNSMVEIIAELATPIDKITPKEDQEEDQEEYQKELLDLNIPSPPDEKSERYQGLIEFESRLTKYKIKTFLKNSSDIKALELFALKNIQILKGLAEDLRLSIKKLTGCHGCLYFLDANHFVLYCLKYHIVYLIQYVQETFSPFIKTHYESEEKLLLELFGESFSIFSMFNVLALLPKEKEFEVFKEKFLEANKEKGLSDEINREDFSIGESLFNHYMEKNKDLSKDIQIINYSNIIHFWNKLIISNKLKTSDIDRCVNDPEIVEILLPLLKEEIEHLQTTNISPKLVFTGFESSLESHQINRLFEELIDIYIYKNTSPEHFKAIFSNKELPKDYIPIKRKKLFKPVLCAYFVYELFQKENPNDYWSIAENCFEVKNLKQSYYNAYQYNPNRKPKGYEKIDSIIKNIYSPIQ